MFTCRFPAAFLVLFALLPGTLPAAPVDFTYEIQPIISSRCFHCHGPDEAARKGHLRLDLREGALKENDGTHAIVPGDPSASELITRILSHDGDEVMPPPKEKHALKEGEIDLFRRWIAEGAEYKPHWSFAKPQWPVLPAAPAEGTILNPIDRFILARLPAGLHQAAEADRATLLRRVSFDLTGLPPSPEEVELFLEDSAPGAYERQVDRLLASPAYGERWARMWLDLARYADSTGYGSDKFRLNIWPWRDWVIAAFNRNLPYDQFTVEQLAGDLLPGASPEQIVATAFHRNTMTNVEGGTIPEEYRVAAVKDRIATTGQVWMGLTVGCAQCHTHKFDPITHRDYYSFYGVFNQTEDANLENEDPRLPLPTPQQLQETERLKGEIAKLEAPLADDAADLLSEQYEWEAAVSQGLPWQVPAKAGEKPKEPAQAPALPENVRAMLAVEPSERDGAQRKAIAEFFRPLSKVITARQGELAARKGELKAIQPVALPIMKELPENKRRETHILQKGNYLAPGEVVQPGLLSAFASFVPPGQGSTRLDVAKWLVHPENPLTARVAVNRFWSQLFGAGLVESEEDFGSQGTLPSHPQLLDWLAVTFQSPSGGEGKKLGLGWDVKGLLRLMVTSATYRQSSASTPETLEKDARNRWLSRGPRKRLEAEAVRDQALLVSGLLSRKIGGPSVYPPQPEGLWKVAFNGGQNGYPTSQGEDRHRRGLYTFWRRTMPPPSMSTFDAPSRESCTVRRQPTNTPLQAFVTMNDPAFVECAQAMARRILREGGGDDVQRLRFAYRLATGHEAGAEQEVSLGRLLEAEQANYRDKTAEAKSLAEKDYEPLPAAMEPGQAAAWTVLANVLLNIDATLTTQ